MMFTCFQKFIYIFFVAYTLLYSVKQTWSSFIFYVNNRFSTKYECKTIAGNDFKFTGLNVNISYEHNRFMLESCKETTVDLKCFQSAINSIMNKMVTCENCVAANRPVYNPLLYALSMYSFQ